jgi:hypothetical protein
VFASAIRRRTTPLHNAANNGHVAVVAALLAHGADVHAKNKFGCGGRSLFWATVGVRRAAVAGRDGIDALQIWMSPYTDTHAPAHTRIHTHIRAYTRRRLALRCVRERISTAGSRRSMVPLCSGTRTWRLR